MPEPSVIVTGVCDGAEAPPAPGVTTYAFAVNELALELTAVIVPVTIASFP